MAEDPSSGETPAGTQSEMPAPGQEPDAEAPDAEAFDKDRAMATIRKLREEAKAAAKAVKAYEALQKEQADAKLSQEERAQKRIAELEERETRLAQQVREKAVRYDIALASQKLGIIDPDAAYRLLDEGALEFDETGSPTNTEKALAALLKARPYLAGQAATGPAPVLGTTNSASRARGPEGARIYRASELNDTAFFRANRDDIARAMNEGRVIPDQ